MPILAQPESRPLLTRPALPRTCTSGSSGSGPPAGVLMSTLRGSCSRWLKSVRHTALLSTIHSTCGQWVGWGGTWWGGVRWGWMGRSAAARTHSHPQPCHKLATAIE